MCLTFSNDIRPDYEHHPDGGASSPMMVPWYPYEYELPEPCSLAYLFPRNQGIWSLLCALQGLRGHLRDVHLGMGAPLDIPPTQDCLDKIGAARKSLEDAWSRVKPGERCHIAHTPPEMDGGYNIEDCTNRSVLHSIGGGACSCIEAGMAKMVQWELERDPYDLGGDEPSLDLN